MIKHAKKNINNKNINNNINKLVHKKNCAIHSLNEVEYFLRNLNIIFKSIKIYNIIK